MRSQPTCGLFLGLGEIPNKQEEVFVYTKTLLATMVTPPKTGEMTVLYSGPHLSYNGREPD